MEDTAQYSEQLAAEVGFYENFTRRRLGVLLEEDATEENTTPQNEKPLVTSRADNHGVEPVLNDDHVGRKANGSAEVTEEEQGMHLLFLALFSLFSLSLFQYQTSQTKTFEI